MKADKLLLFWLKWKQSVKRNPIESFLAVCFCILWLSLLFTDNHAIVNLLRYAPVVFLLACIFHAHSKQKVVRWLYYLSPLLLLIPFYGIDEAVVSLHYFFTLVIIQILYILATSRKDDHLFANGALNYVKSVGISFVLSLTILITLWAIIASISYIFDIWKGNEDDWLLAIQAIAWAFCMPLLFVLFQDTYKDKAIRPSKAFHFLLNYILSPALIIYTVILYLYMLKIVIAFELPKGQIAYMVTAFVSAFFILKGCQCFLEKPIYVWFYRGASWITLPTLILCWVGIVYRIREYGFTEPRVYLIAVVSVLTLTAFLFFFRRLPHYTIAAWFATILFSIITYIPGISAKHIEDWSQAQRPESEKKARQEEMITILSKESMDISGYKQLYFLDSFSGEGNYYLTSKDCLSLYIQDSLVYHNHFSRIFANQMQQAGLSLSDSIPEGKYTELLCVDLDSALILFENYTLFRTDSGYHVQYMQPKCYLTR